ncbi:MAG: TrpR like protein, YerC/YecD [Hellea sp.]|nr:TrpR like protein, YerC/YecD [Hellea sp.]
MTHININIIGLNNALTELKTPEEMRRFLVDLCTPAELRALSERWQVAQLLNQTDMSYRDISAQTGVSTTTIGRVARFLKDEPHQGYRIVLDRLKDH